MDLKTKLESIANNITPVPWKPVYARKDYQNLIDATDFVADSIKGYAVGETMLVIDPIKRKNRKSNLDYSGYFMVLTKSNLDETYDEKYSLYIEPLLEIIHRTVYNSLNCDFDVIQLESTEVINMFDWNADGLLVTYQLKGY